MGSGPVLVVEDDADIREGLVEFLQDDGFDVFAAEHGQQALDQLRATPSVRAILLDLNMPVMDGKSFRQRQLAEPELASIPVIVISAVADCSRVAVELQAAECFQKPISWEKLLHALEAYR